MSYCPRCGTEYCPGFAECYDCQVPLQDEPPRFASQPEEGGAVVPSIPRLGPDPIEVFRSGRHLEAELVRGRLESAGLNAAVWSGGMGPWRMESALTEVTGVPNDFNAHRVMVARDDEEEARAIVDERPSDTSDWALYEGSPRTALSWLRKPWLIPVIIALPYLAVLLLGGDG